jgi:hypothetical protein
MVRRIKKTKWLAAFGLWALASPVCAENEDKSGGTCNELIRIYLAYTVRYWCDTPNKQVVDVRRLQTACAGAHPNYGGFWMSYQCYDFKGGTSF